MRKSNLDVAFEIVSKRDSAISFNELWDEIKKIQGIEDDAEGNHIAKFYTALSLDGRFITIGDNKWDLRTRYTFDKVHIDMNDVYVDEDTDEVIEVSDDDTVSCRLYQFSLHCEFLRLYKRKESTIKAALPEQAVMDIPKTVSVSEYLRARGFTENHIGLVTEAAERQLDALTGLKLLGIVKGGNKANA